MRDHQIDDRLVHPDLHRPTDNTNGRTGDNCTPQKLPRESSAIHASPPPQRSSAPDMATVRARDAPKSLSRSRPIPIKRCGAGSATAEPDPYYDWATWQMYTLITNARKRRAQTTSDPESRPRPSQLQQQPPPQSQAQPRPQPQPQPQPQPRRTAVAGNAGR